MIHFYFGIDISTLWKIINKNIPTLFEKLKNIIKKEVGKTNLNLKKIWVDFDKCRN